MNFTEDQLKELELIYGLKRVVETLPVKDGVVAEHHEVWWRSEDGPELVMARDHWDNIKGYPDCYQLRRPIYKISYKD